MGTNQSSANTSRGVSPRHQIPRRKELDQLIRCSYSKGGKEKEFKQARICVYVQDKDTNLICKLALHNNQDNSSRKGLDYYPRHITREGWTTWRSISRLRDGLLRPCHRLFRPRHQQLCHGLLQLRHDFNNSI